MSLKQWLGLITSRSRKAAPANPDRDSGDTRRPITRLWTCSGKFFGYRLDDALFTCNGNQVGQFTEGDEIYDSNGEYVGEIRLLNRLITNLSKTTWRRTPYLSQTGARFKRSGDLQPIQIKSGFEDFPSSSSSE